MYALAIIRYRRPLEEVAKFTDAHRTYLRQLKEQGTLIASGPFDPRVGGAILLRINENDVQAALDRIRDNDPYIKRKMVQYELLPWNINIGVEGLDNIK